MQSYQGALKLFQELFLKPKIPCLRPAVTVRLGNVLDGHGDLPAQAPVAQPSVIPRLGRAGAGCAGEAAAAGSSDLHILTQMAQGSCSWMQFVPVCPVLELPLSGADGCCAFPARQQRPAAFTAQPFPAAPC